MREGIEERECKRNREGEWKWKREEKYLVDKDRVNNKNTILDVSVGIVH